jgi:hypothetical protein
MKHLKIAYDLLMIIIGLAASKQETAEIPRRKSDPNWVALLIRFALLLARI